MGFIISNSIPGEKLTKFGRLFYAIYWRLNKVTSNPSIIFQNVVIRLNALHEMIDFRTEFNDYANIFVVLLRSVRKKFVSVDLFSFVNVMKDVKEGALSSIMLPFHLRIGMSLRNVKQ